MTDPDVVKLMNKLYIDNGTSQKIIFPRGRKHEEKFDWFITLLDSIICRPEDDPKLDFIKDWYYSLAEKMDSELRILHHCYTAPWSYSQEQYELYAETQEQMRRKTFERRFHDLEPEEKAKGPSQDVVGPETMSFETFQWVCDYYDTRWAAPGYLATICEEILALAPTISLSKSPIVEGEDLTWYDDGTETAFKKLHALLLEEEQAGTEKVRLVKPIMRLY